MLQNCSTVINSNLRISYYSQCSLPFTNSSKKPSQYCTEIFNILTYIVAQRFTLCDSQRSIYQRASKIDVVYRKNDGFYREQFMNQPFFKILAT